MSPSKSTPLSERNVRVHLLLPKRTLLLFELQLHLAQHALLAQTLFDEVYKFIAENGKLDKDDFDELLSTKGGVLRAKQAMTEDNSRETAKFFESLSRKQNSEFELAKAMTAAWRV